uniref:Secreted protein n=1 Tax=Setaria viridis TaxID=4556 RepID=A0A4U6W2G0_SETVI|nr:hypothetical protein SEVIR_2G421900v2 [Setaria viridis]
MFDIRGLLLLLLHCCRCRHGSRTCTLRTLNLQIENFLSVPHLKGTATAHFAILHCVGAAGHGRGGRQHRQGPPPPSSGAGPRQLMRKGCRRRGCRCSPGWR